VTEADDVENELLRMGNSYVDIMEKYADTVLRVCLVFMKNKADAEDVFQNVFLKLCEAKPHFNDEGHIKAWLITVARNECKNQLHSFWRRKVTCIDEIVLPVKNTEDKEVVKAVVNLPLKYRDIVYLFYFENYKINELSKLLNLKEPTVKTRLKRGRELLKDILLSGGFRYE
jgi:RNA polymerase sigma factor (sigma-70 family)